MRVLYSLFLSILFTSLSFGQTHYPWGVTDTVTSGNFDDLNPVLDHGGMESRTTRVFPGYQWLVFDRTDSSGSSVIAKRYSNRTLTWEKGEYVLASHMVAGVMHHPDVATLSDTSSLAVWQQDIDGSRNIVFSRWDGESWSQPDTLTHDTSDNTSPRVRIFESAENTPVAFPYFVGWKSGSSIRYAMIGSGGVDSTGTAVSTDNDSLEFDLCQSGRFFYLAWTSRDTSGTIRLCLAGMNPYASLPAFRVLDTLDFSGSVVNPHIVTYSTFTVFFDSRIDGRWNFYSAGVTWLDDTTWSPVQEYIDDNLAADNLNAQGWSGPVLVESLKKSVPRYRPSINMLGFFVYESRSSQDSSLIFSSVYSPDTMSGPGYNYSPTIGSFVAYVGLNQSGVAAWVSNRQGRSHIYSRVFWISGDAVVEPPQPTGFFLNQNYPNPFNPTTTIRFSVPGSGSVVLKVYDVLGRLVKTLVSSRQTPGEHVVVFDGRGLASGVYFCRLQSDDYTQVRKMILMK